MSSLNVAVGKPEVAAQLFGWTDATREKIGDSRPKLEQADMAKIITSCIERMGKIAFSDMHKEGKNGKTHMIYRAK